MKVYAGLELGIAASAILYFLLLDLYHLIYSPIFAVFGDSRPLWVTIKFLLALGVLFPPAFFMGGTLPVMGQYLIRRPEQLGRLEAFFTGSTPSEPPWVLSWRDSISLLCLDFRTPISWPWWAVWRLPARPTFSIGMGGASQVKSPWIGFLPAVTQRDP